jgi:cytochrome b561
MSTSKSIKRYNPVLVSLHWLVVLLVFGALLFLGGGEGGEDGPVAASAASTNLHMIVGIVVLVLMAVRLVVRLSTQRPGWAVTGNDFLNKLGEWTHYGLYFFTFAITITGIALASQTNRLAALFGGGAAGQAEGEGIRFGLGAFHGISWAMLFLLILLHLAGWAYHQFMLKDNLFSRMWYGNRSE